MIVGAGGGIGLAILGEAAHRLNPCRIIATHRQPVSSVEEQISWLDLNFDDPAQLARQAEHIAQDLESLDYLIFASGLLHGDAISPEKKLGDWDAHQFQQVMWVNAGAPLTVFASLQPALSKSPQPKVMFLSAQIGSISDNQSGGWYSYRMSKAALNMGVRTAAIEAARWRNAASIVAVHPGTTTSALSKPFTQRRRNLSTPTQTARQLVELLVNLTPAQSGLLLNRDGSVLPW